MRCGKCQLEIAPGQTFCQHCGWEVVETPVMETPVMGNPGLRCPACNSELVPGVLFCNVCGTPVAPAAPVAPIVTAPVLRESREKKKSNVAVIILSIALSISLIAGGVLLGITLINNSDDEVVSSREKDDEEKDKDDSEENEKDKDNENEENEEKAKEEEEEVEEEPADAEEPEEEPVEEERYTNPPVTNEIRYDNTYIFPSDRIYITSADLYGLSRAQVALMRNEIFARHGHIFNKEPNISYFNSKAWYVPRGTVTESQLSSIERANVEFLVQYEEERGWR